MRIPAAAIEELGGGGRIPVVATFDGISYRGSIVRMGGESVLGMLKEIREVLGKGHGDEVGVSVEPDVEEREGEVPAELATLLKTNSAALGAFGALSYTHRREHASYVAEAKKPEARERRARKTVETLTRLIPGRPRPTL